MNEMKRVVGIEGVSFEDFIEMEISRNCQYRYIAPLRPSDFSAVGITDDFEKSVRLIKSMIGIPEDVSFTSHLINRSKPYHDSTTRKRIYRNNTLDVEVYREAKEHFHSLCSRYLNE
jgi:hypothetical protein